MAIGKNVFCKACLKYAYYAAVVAFLLNTLIYISGYAFFIGKAKNHYSLHQGDMIAPSTPEHSTQNKSFMMAECLYWSGYKIKAVAGVYKDKARNACPIVRSFKG